MNREEILKKSQKDGEGKPDERELVAYGKAGRVGMIVGGVLCVFLVILGRYILKVPEVSLASWMVYWAMWGSNYLGRYFK